MVTNVRGPIAVLGAGKMAGAIVQGLLASTEPGSLQIRLTTRTEATAASLASSLAAAAPAVTSTEFRTTETDPNANVWAADGAELVLVAVKPAMVADVLREVAGSLRPGVLVVSVAAGVTCESIQSALAEGGAPISGPDGVTVVRSMPNTPALVGRGVTGIASPFATPDQMAAVEALFQAVGQTLVVPEDQIDALSTISGSGPAYVFYFIEQLETAAMKLGFTSEEAALMVRETFAGASELLAASTEPPAQLRNNVTSPGGTTEQAIAQFQAANLEGVFQMATLAALNKAKKLAAQ